MYCSHNTAIIQHPQIILHKMTLAGSQRVALVAVIWITVLPRAVLTLTCKNGYSSSGNLDQTTLAKLQAYFQTGGPICTGPSCAVVKQIAGQGSFNAYSCMNSGDVSAVIQSYWNVYMAPNEIMSCSGNMNLKQYPVAMLGACVCTDSDYCAGNGGSSNVVSYAVAFAVVLAWILKP